MSSSISDHQALISAAEDLVKTHMASYDPSHDWYHVDRVRRTALSLSRSLPPSPAHQPDMLVLELAALFHDLNDAKYSSASGPVTTASILEPFFSGPGSDVTLEQQGEICRVVDNVSWSKEKKLRAKGEWEDGWRETSVELACVQDADRLDAIGGFGILRCSAYSASVNRPLYIPPGQPGWEETAIQHFHDKLFHIKGEAMKTEMGRKLAEKRQALMRAFVEGVEEEYGLLDQN